MLIQFIPLLISVLGIAPIAQRDVHHTRGRVRAFLLLPSPSHFYVRVALVLWPKSISLCLTY